MDTSRVRAWALGHRSPLVLFSAVLFFIGAELILFPPKGHAWEVFGIPFLAAGGLLLAYLYLPTGEVAAPKEATLATRLLDRLTLGGRLRPFLPLLGLMLIAVDIGYNVFLSAQPALLDQDLLVLLLAGYLIIFRFVPASYSVARDTVFVFVLTLNIILTVPLLAFRAARLDFGASVDAYAWAMLAPQTSAVMNLFGAGSWVGSCDAIRLGYPQYPGWSSAFSCAGVASPGIAFIPQHGQYPAAIFITTACSGIYSFGLFTSIFVAYVTTEYRQVTRRIVLFLVVGALASYAANILRMAIIGLVGYYTQTPGEDVQNMLLAHSNAGLLIFLGWISLFMGLMFKFLKPPPDDAPQQAPAPEAPRPRGSRCPICGEALSPTITGRRCACGRLYHEHCLAALGDCPSCHTLYRSPAGLPAAPVTREGASVSGDPPPLASAEPRE